MARSTVLLLFVLLHGVTAGAGMPRELADALGGGGVPADEVQEAERQPQAWIYEHESRGRQVTVIGLAKVPASPETLTKDLLKRDGILQSEALRQIGVFSDPAAPADVAKFRLPDSDIEALTDCEVGDCKFKLGERGVADLEKVDWSQPDARERVDALMRAAMVRSVRLYQERGREALLEAVDKDEPQSLAEGADRLTAQLGLSTRMVPALRDHLLHYPKAGIEGARDRILWTIRDYGYRPVISLVHSIIYQPPGKLPVTLIALKSLYTSHYFHARQRLIGLWADSGNPNATYLGFGDRLLFDDDVGSIKRRMLEAGVVKDTIARLELLRAAYE
jgi:hypothetical protein